MNNDKIKTWIEVYAPSAEDVAQIVLEETRTLLIRDASGVYVPQIFCENWEMESANVEDWETCLRGPKSEWYWEAWDGILNRWKDLDGNTIEQNGDLWVIDNKRIDEIREIVESLDMSWDDITDCMWY